MKISKFILGLIIIFLIIGCTSNRKIEHDEESASIEIEQNEEPVYNGTIRVIPIDLSDIVPRNYEE